MNIPRLHGTIDRSILLNYRIAPEVAARHLPAPFRPQIIGGVALGGICLIRLKGLRPRAVPARDQARPHEVRAAVRTPSVDKRRHQ